jgi:hypothetical protein
MKHLFKEKALCLTVTFPAQFNLLVSLWPLILGIGNYIVVDHDQDEDQRTQHIGEKSKIVVVDHLQDKSLHEMKVCCSFEYRFASTMSCCSARL